MTFDKNIAYVKLQNAAVVLYEKCKSSVVFDKKLERMVVEIARKYHVDEDWLWRRYTAGSIYTEQDEMEYLSSKVRKIKKKMRIRVRLIEVRTLSYNNNLDIPFQPFA